MSKFFAAESSSDDDDDDDDESESESGSDEEPKKKKKDGSDSDSDEDSDEEDSEEEEEKKEAPKADAKPRGMAAFMKDADDDDSDDDDDRRVVKSHRDKKWEQITDAVSVLRGQLKDEDWVKVSASFDNINKMLAKAATLVAKEGIPEFYFRLLSDLESAADRATADKAALKKMSSANAKAANTLKQKLRKVCKPYEAQLAKLREKKAKGGGDDDDDDEDDGPPKPPAKVTEVSAKKLGKGGPTGPKPISQYNEGEIDERLDELLGKRGRKGTNKQEEISVLQQLEAVTKRASKRVELLGHIISFNFDIHNNMLTAMPTRVWKEVFEHFRKLLTTLIDNPDLKVQQVEGTTVVDAVQMTAAEVGDEPDEFIDTGVTQMTGNVLSYLERLDDEFYKSLQLADPHTPDYVARLKDEVPLVNLMQDTLGYYDKKRAALADAPSEGDASTAAEREAESEGVSRDAARVACRIVEHVYYREQQLFNTAMQNAEKRKVALKEACEVAERAYKQAKLAALAEAEDEDDDDDDDDDEDTTPKKVSEVQKAEKAALAAFQAAQKAFAEFTVPRPMELASELQALSKRVYAFGTDRAKTRTLLCVVYHAALHEKYTEARDLILMSHLSDSIHQFDISTQILYNRALVRCGICAFQRKLIPEAHAALMELAAGSRLKELLAQGVSSARFGDRNPEQEKQERRRLVPYHMHINLELVEAVHLVCAMLLELPNLAHNAFDPRRRTSTVSRAFRRQLEHFDRQVFNGPPEHTRDFVMSASQLVLEGKWEKAAETLAKLPAWEVLPDPEAARTLIRKQLMTEGLRAFLISSYAHFESISLAGLAERFSIPEADAHAVVSRMLLSHELHACWDQPTATLAVQRTEPSKLQFLALQFAEKTAQFVEANETLLDTRSGANRDERRGERDGGYARERRPWVERGDRYRDRDGGGYRGGGRGGGGYRGGRDRDGGGYRDDRGGRDRGYGGYGGYGDDRGGRGGGKGNRRG